LGLGEGGFALPNEGASAVHLVLLSLQLGGEQTSEQVLLDLPRLVAGGLVHYPHVPWYGVVGHPLVHESPHHDRGHSFACCGRDVAGDRLVGDLVGYAEDRRLLDSGVRDA